MAISWFHISSHVVKSTFQCQTHRGIFWNPPEFTETKNLRLLLGLILFFDNSGGFQKIPQWVWYCNVDLTTWEVMWNQEMAISRGLPHLDLHLKNAVLHSKMSKVLLSANLLGHCYHSQKPVWWFMWLSMHLAFTPESNSDIQKKYTTKVQISSHMAS